MYTLAGRAEEARSQINAIYELADRTGSDFVRNAGLLWEAAEEAEAGNWRLGRELLARLDGLTDDHPRRLRMSAELECYAGNLEKGRQILQRLFAMTGSIDTDRGTDLCCVVCTAGIAAYMSGDSRVAGGAVALGESLLRSPISAYTEGTIRCGLGLIAAASNDRAAALEHYESMVQGRYAEYFQPEILGLVARTAASSTRL